VYVFWICFGPHWQFLQNVDPETKRVHETRDVIWLKHMFYKKPVTAPEVIVLPSEDVEEHGIKAGEGDGQLNDTKADEDVEDAAVTGQPHESARKWGLK